MKIFRSLIGFFGNFLKELFFRIKHFTLQFDAMWSVPLGILLFIGYPTILYKLGFVAEAYPLSSFHAFILACIIVVSATNFSVIGLYFTFRDLFNQIYSKQGREDFKGLNQIFRICVSVFLFLVFYFSVIVVFLKIV
jgi:hypothetical protein